MHYLQKAHKIKTFLWCVLRLLFHILLSKINEIISTKLGIGGLQYDLGRTSGAAVKTRNAYTILIQNYVGKSSLGGVAWGWKGNIKMYLKKQNVRAFLVSKVKGTVAPFHAMKANWGRGSMAPIMFNLVTRLKWVASNVLSNF
jgi:hypothetical protein